MKAPAEVGRRWKLVRVLAPRRTRVRFNICSTETRKRCKRDDTLAQLHQHRFTRTRFAACTRASEPRSGIKQRFLPSRGSFRKRIPRAIRCLKPRGRKKKYVISPCQRKGVECVVLSVCTMRRTDENINFEKRTESRNP